MSKARLLTEMDSVEISEWRAWDKLHPLTDFNWLFGNLCAATHNALAGGKTKVEDWMPRWVKPLDSKAREEASKAAFMKLAEMSKEGRIRPAKKKHQA